MDHLFVWNACSFPTSPEQAYSQLLSSARGLLAAKGEGDRISLFCDGDEPLLRRPVAHEYTFGDFITELGGSNEEDLQLVLLEIEDKTPAFDYINDEEFLQLSNEYFYFPGLGYNGSVDVLALAWFFGASLFSVASSELWAQDQIEFSIYEEGKPRTETVSINNVSSELHGRALRSHYDDLVADPDLSQKFPQSKFTNEFLEWHAELSPENGLRVRTKLEIAHQRNFQGGKPLFETLKNADGMREMRFSAYPGGATRILFGHVAGETQAILIGFIKKADGEGYAENIPTALRLWESLKESLH